MVHMTQMDGSDLFGRNGLGYARLVVDSHQPRFSQGVLAVVLAIAFLFEASWVVPVMAVLLLASVVGGPRWNLMAYAYRALPIPPGEPEPIGPPRFAQTLGVIFLSVATIGLFAAQRESTAWDLIGWGPALLVAVLAGLAATTSF
jgi:Domain of unknown function (DUF4395)